MSDFKLGDLVKRIADPAHDCRYMVSGEVYTVTGLPINDCESLQVNGFADYWDIDYFELYKPQQIIVEAEPTVDVQSELEEALAKIETLESALEDAVRELISLRDGNNKAVIDVGKGEFKPEGEEIHFKPIRKMALEDWELAKEEGWVFEMNNYEIPVQVTQVDYGDTSYPVEFSDYMWRTLDGYEWDEKLDTTKNIIKRIK